MIGKAKAGRDINIVIRRAGIGAAGLALILGVVVLMTQSTRLTDFILETFLCDCRRVEVLSVDLSAAPTYLVTTNLAPSDATFFTVFRDMSSALWRIPMGSGTQALMISEDAPRSGSKLLLQYSPQQGLVRVAEVLALLDPAMLTRLNSEGVTMLPSSALAQELSSTLPNPYAFTGCSALENLTRRGDALHALGVELSEFSTALAIARQGEGCR